MYCRKMKIYFLFIIMMAVSNLAFTMQERALGGAEPSGRKMMGSSCWRVTASSAGRTSTHSTWPRGTRSWAITDGWGRSGCASLAEGSHAYSAPRNLETACGGSSTDCFAS